MKHPFHIQIPYIPETRKGEKEKEQEIVKVPHYFQYRNETIREARWITQIWKGLPLPQAREGGHSLNLIA